MEYFKILNFTREPFSNSPDPEAFFQSRQHVGCLQKMELAIRMRRGLNVVIGDVGTGKTTLCRQLIRLTADDEKIESHLILDPNFSSDSEFLQAVARMFLGQKASASASDWQLKEEIKQYLFKRGVDEQNIIMLIIDEGQKIPEFCLEILREFLNYETNDFKLLQIVIFAQKEFAAKVKARQNFADRINLYHTLNPLNFQETRAMILYRLDLASAGKMGATLFSLPAHWVVYKATKGYPRKIINLCHRIVLTMIIQNRNKAGFFLALSCVKRVFPEQAVTWKLAGTGIVAAVLVLLVLIGIAPEHLFSAASLQEPEKLRQAPVQHVVAKAPLPDPADKKSPGAKTAEKVQKNTMTASIALADEATTKENVVQVPELLGNIAVSGEETLSRMIYLVYGPLSAFREKNMETFLQANPRIHNPDMIQPGDVIAFPLMQIEVEPLLPGTWWIQLARRKTLAEAYQAMLLYAGLKNKIRLIPLQESAGGVQFVIVARQGFSSQEAAREELQRMPAAIAAEAAVATSLDLGQSLFQLAGKRENIE
jgi:general secretion pathway protein A